MFAPLCLALMAILTCADATSCPVAEYSMLASASGNGVYYMDEAQANSGPVLDFEGAKQKCLDQGMALASVVDAAAVQDLKTYVDAEVRIDFWADVSNPNGVSCTALSDCDLLTTDGVTAVDASCFTSLNLGSADASNSCVRIKDEDVSAEAESCASEEGYVCQCPPPTHGGWSDWTLQSCDAAECSSGNAVEVRTCTNPAPAHHGSGCVGVTTRNVLCQGPCPGKSSASCALLCESFDVCNGFWYEDSTLDCKLYEILNTDEVTTNLDASSLYLYSIA